MVAAMSAAIYLDTVAAEVAGAFASHGIDCLLLKGPAMQAAFYRPGEFRPYGDVDLLVERHELERAGEVLQSLGFYERLARSANVDTHVASSAWDRPHPDAAIVDLHRSFYGVVNADALWRGLTADSPHLVVGGAPVRVPSKTGLALIAVLHAATAQAGHARPIEDLRRAAELLELDEWRLVGEKLRDVGALALAVATLREFGHAEIANAIATGSVPSAEVLAARGVNGSGRLLLLLRTSSWTHRLRLIARTLWPTAAYMRWLAVNAGREPRAIAIERAVRTLRMLAHSVLLVKAAYQVRVTSRRRLR